MANALVSQIAPFYFGQGPWASQTWKELRAAVRHGDRDEVVHKLLRVYDVMSRDSAVRLADELLVASEPFRAGRQA